MNELNQEWTYWSMNMKWSNYQFNPFLDPANDTSTPVISCHNAAVKWCPAPILPEFSTESGHVRTGEKATGM